MAATDGPPPGTGQSMTTSGEQIATDEDEAGHESGGTSGADRPAGTSSARAATSVDPQDPVDPQSPRLTPP